MPTPIIIFFIIIFMFLSIVALAEEGLKHPLFLFFFPSTLLLFAWFCVATYTRPTSTSYTELKETTDDNGNIIQYFINPDVNFIKTKTISDGVYFKLPKQVKITTFHSNLLIDPVSNQRYSYKILTQNDVKDNLPQTTQ